MRRIGRGHFANNISRSCGDDKWMRLSFTYCVHVQHLVGEAKGYHMEDLDELSCMDIFRLSLLRVTLGLGENVKLWYHNEFWVLPKCDPSWIYRGDSHFTLPNAEEIIEGIFIKSSGFKGLCKLLNSLGCNWGSRQLNSVSYGHLRSAMFLDYVCRTSIHHITEIYLKLNFIGTLVEQEFMDRNIVSVNISTSIPWFQKYGTGIRHLSN